MPSTPALASALLLATALVGLSTLALAQDDPPCQGPVDTECNHETADGTCKLYAGVPVDHCLAYGPSSSHDCSGLVDFGCNHWSAPGTCAVYWGPTDRCIIW